MALPNPSARARAKSGRRRWPGACASAAALAGTLATVARVGDAAPTAPAAARAAPTAGTAPSAAIPPGFESYEVRDLTFTMRDDTYRTLTLHPTDPNTAYLGTYEGRLYKTTNRGATWKEV